MFSLLVRSANRICALPLSEVEETMRELECVPCAGAPSWVRGASVIRGAAIPVVDLAALLGGERSGERGRFVTVRSKPSRVALLVDDVVGVRALSTTTDAKRLPLLASADRRLTEELATLDGALLSILDVSDVVPDEVHRAIAGGEAT